MKSSGLPCPASLYAVVVASATKLLTPNLRVRYDAPQHPVRHLWYEAANAHGGTSGKCWCHASAAVLGSIDFQPCADIDLEVGREAVDGIEALQADAV